MADDVATARAEAMGRNGLGGARRMQKSLLPPQAASYHCHYAIDNYH